MNPAWPDIDVARWSVTKRSLHRYTQILGKLRVTLSPAQPNWLFTPLYLSARGLTTGFIPYKDTSVEALLDVFDSTIAVQRSDGAQRRIELVPARTVADVYAAFERALDELDIACTITPAAQEMPDTTPLNEDTRTAEYDPEAVRRWFHAATTTCGIFEHWRSHFFGRSGIQLWWGAFDVALVLFNGKHVSPPRDRGYLLKYDLDAELMNVGLYAGDENTPPFFYGYIFPQPAGAEQMTMAPAAVTWSQAFGEWILPYEAVRTSPEPATLLLQFLDALYARCVTSAGWNAADLSYDAPKPVHRI
jgi:hypothetical protein